MLLPSREVQAPNFGSGERDGCDGVLSELFALFPASLKKTHQIVTL